MSRSGRWPAVRKLAWNRDRKARAVCHICKQPIDYSLAASSCPDAWEPDHVIPVSKRPDLELDLNNIKASHMRCNRDIDRLTDIKKEVLESINRVLLPEYIAILTDRYVNCMTLERIAEEYEVSYRTVCVRLGQALQIFRTENNMT